MEKIKEEPWSYTLYQDGDSLVLSVLCGTSAMYETVIRLDAEEMKMVDSGLLSDLVSKIRNSPKSYQERRLTGI